jgi:K+-sensing histidine kinase KdpD
MDSARLLSVPVATADDRVAVIGPKGIGIGMTISQSIVSAHGERIWLLNDTPAGADFRLQLP